MVAGIVAVDRNWGIGLDNKLLVHLPEDMKFFRDTTLKRKKENYSTMVVCGRKTYESFPKRPLPNRKNIVITRRAEEGATVTADEDVNFLHLGDFLKWFATYKGEHFDIFVIGGAEIYKILLPICEKVYVTKIEAEFEADTFFPNLDEDEEFYLKSEGERLESKDLGYRFTVYERVKTE